MNRVRLGAVGYLNARPLVYGLDRSPLFALRFDVPSQCATLLHEGAIDVGLIPSIEYLRAPASGRGEGYRIVPGVAIASRGPVSSVALYVRKPLADVRSIAMDTSSRTSVALVNILCQRAFGIRPRLEPERPDLHAMLTRSDAALLIGDKALFSEHERVEKIDLGEAWTTMTGLPFVYAFWAGRPDSMTSAHVKSLQEARDAGVARPEELARLHVPDSPQGQAMAARYLRDNIKYGLGADERAGLELFFRYAAEERLVESVQELLFF
jgi:chorismate dehydratase